MTESGRPASTIHFGRPGLDEVFGGAMPRRAAVIAQPSVTSVARELLAECRDGDIEAAVTEIPDREAAKTLEVAGDLYRWLNGLGLTRNDWIVGVGGGAATDLAGFVAATYLRGVAVSLVPTTLLAAVDAAIGGKTAVNIDGKNLVGVFRHADRVVIDVESVAAAPLEVTREGHAEAIKAGLIADAHLFGLYEAQGPDVDLTEVIERAVRVKADVVSEDFTEQGRRMILNYGHTVGHGIEVAMSIPHGHAIGLGMIVAAAIAEQRLGFAHADRQRAVLASVGLPTSLPHLHEDEVMRLVGLDKKRDDDGLRMVLLEDIAAPIVAPVEATTVRAALRAITPH